MKSRRSETAPQQVAEGQISPFPFLFGFPNTILSIWKICPSSTFIDDLRSPYPLGFALFEPIILHATFYYPMEFGHVCSLRNPYTPLSSSQFRTPSSPPSGLWIRDSSWPISFIEMFPNIKRPMHIWYMVGVYTWIEPTDFFLGFCFRL